MGELINGRTPEEIKSAINACISSNRCLKYECVYYETDCNIQKFVDLLSLIERLEAAQPKWISVKERLPEENQTVLVWADGCASIAEVYDKDMLTSEPVWSYTGLGTSPWYWMPLPKPTEEET